MRYLKQGLLALAWFAWAAAWWFGFSLFDFDGADCPTKPAGAAVSR